MHLGAETFVRYTGRGVGLLHTIPAYNSFSLRFLRFSIFRILPTALIEKVKQSLASVCTSVRLSVPMFPLYLLNRLTFEVEFVYAGGS